MVAQIDRQLRLQQFNNKRRTEEEDADKENSATKREIKKENEH